MYEFQYPIKPIILNPDITKTAAMLLPEQALDLIGWKTWIDSIQKETKCSRKEIFINIRLALTALETGPELQPMLKFLGSKKIKDRMNGKYV